MVLDHGAGRGESEGLAFFPCEVEPAWKAAAWNTRGHLLRSWHSRRLMSQLRGRGCWQEGWLGFSEPTPVIETGQPMQLVKWVSSERF